MNFDFERNAMKRNATIWMVKGNGPSTNIHQSRQSAEAEAKRLANMRPGEDFYVMQAVSIHRNISTERVALDGLTEDGSLPF